MHYEELAPAPGLRDIVRCYWWLWGDPGGPGGDNAEPDANAEPALPDGSPELIVNLADPFVAYRPGEPPTLQPSVMLVGQITGPFVVGPSGRVDLIAVRFEAHGAAMLFHNLAELTGRWAGAELLPRLAPQRLHASLSQAATLPDRGTLLDRALHALHLAHPPEPRVAQAVHAIRDSAGTVPLDELARTIGLSLRTLQRLFGTQVGISPKLLARIIRFQRVFTAWRADPGSLARVAAECGYFDQSHLVRDFRDFAGAAPAAFLAEQPEFTAFFTSR